MHEKKWCVQKTEFLENLSTQNNFGLMFNYFLFIKWKIYYERRIGPRFYILFLFNHNLGMFLRKTNTISSNRKKIFFVLSNTHCTLPPWILNTNLLNGTVTGLFSFTIWLHLVSIFMYTHLFDLWNVQKLQSSHRKFTL